MQVHSLIAPILAAVTLLACPFCHTRDVQAAGITFDLPSSVECRDITTQEFAIANPKLRQIEVKVRISARQTEGAIATIVQFDYEIRVGSTIRVIDYQPKTLLESSIAQDQVEVTSAAEDSQANGVDAHVNYKPLIFGGSHTTTAKRSEAKHFKQMASQDVVLASGTVEREHGVFFRVRASRVDAFEGLHDFTLIVAVPRGWRADVCEISCIARVTKQSMMTSSESSSGGLRTSVGMYLVGDAEAAASAEQLRNAQDLYQLALAVRQQKSDVFHTLSRAASSVFERDATLRNRRSIAEARKSLDAAQDHLKLLSAVSSSGVSSCAERGCDLLDYRVALNPSHQTNPSCSTRED